MKTEKLLAVLRLQATQNVGDIIAKKLINVTGSVEQIFKESRKSLATISGIGSLTIQNLLDEKNLKRAEEELQYLQQNNISFSCFLDEDYPENLKHCIDAPILFLRRETST